MNSREFQLLGIQGDIHTLQEATRMAPRYAQALYVTHAEPEWIRATLCRAAIATSDAMFPPDLAEACQPVSHLIDHYLDQLGIHVDPLPDGPGAPMTTEFQLAIPVDGTAVFLGALALGLDTPEGERRLIISRQMHMQPTQHQWDTYLFDRYVTCGPINLFSHDTTT